MGINSLPEIDPLEVKSSRLEESYERTLVLRSAGLSPSFRPLPGFSATRLRAKVSPERYDPQVNPVKHTMTVSSIVTDSEVEIDSRKMRAIWEPGNFTVIPRGSVTNGYCHTSSEFIYLQIEQQCLELIGEEIDGPAKIDLLPILQGRDELLRHLTHSLVDELNKGATADTLYAEVLARAAVAHIVKNFGISLLHWAKNEKLPSNALGTVLDYVTANLDRSIGLEEIARVAGVSPSTLQRRFKCSMGQSLHQYVIRQRVKRATELLSNRHMSLAEIACATGFADQSHLTRVIKQYTGVTPRALRPR